MPSSVPSRTTCIRLILALLPALALAELPADRAVPRTDEPSKRAHEQRVERARRGGVDLYFLGDSITRRWAGTDYPEFLAHWNQTFDGWNAANFGWGADTTQNILWRLENGELDGVTPKVIVLLAGTNNVGLNPPRAAVDEVPKGIKAIIDLCRTKVPGATIVLTAIFPRNDNPESNQAVRQINVRLATLADGKRVRFLNVNDRLADRDGQLREGMTMDKLHPTLKGYQVWADGLIPILTELLGPRRQTSGPSDGDPVPH